MKNWYQTQKGYFVGSLYEEMKKNKNIWLVTVDLGYGMFDKIKEEFPDRYVNVGAAEQVAIGIAIGLAQEGKIPFVYTITSFFLRAAETISLYLHNEQTNVKLVGSGRDDDYGEDGVSHFAFNVQAFLKLLDIRKFNPNNKEEVPVMLKEMIKTNKPCFLSLKRSV